MPLLKDININDPAYPLTSFVSEWTNVSSATYTTFSVCCSGACDIEIEYAFDDQFQICDTFTTPILAGTIERVCKPVSTQFQRYKVVNIAPPVDLKLQVWFFQEGYGDDLTGVVSDVNVVNNPGVTVLNTPNVSVTNNPGVNVLNDPNVNVVNFSKDAFGSLSVSDINPIFQSIFTYGLPAQKFNQTTTGTGNITNGNQLVNVSTGASASSSALLESIKFIKYHAGQGLISRFTGLFTPGVIGNTQRIGLLTDTDGIGFGYNGVDFGIFYRNNTVDVWINQTNWNLDPMDGSGPSGANIDFSLGFGNVFQIKIQYLGFGSHQLFCENPTTAEFVKVHVIQYANTATSPSFLVPSFPLAVECINTTNATDITVSSASMMAGIEGVLSFNGPSFADSVLGLSTTTSETFGGAWDMLSTFNGITNRINLYIKQFSSTTGTNDRPHILRFYKNGTYTAPVWTEISAGNSSVRRLTGGTWNGDGMKLYEIFIPGRGDILLEKFDLKDGNNLVSVGGDNWIVTFESLAGNGTVEFSYTWLEDM